MAYTPVVLDDFPGLDIRDPLQATGAIDCYNVIRGREGEIRVRNGCYDFGSIDGTPIALHLANAGNTPDAVANYLIGLGGTDAYAIDYNGDPVDSISGQTVSSAVNFGTTSVAYTLCAIAGDPGDTLHQFDGSVFLDVSYTGTNPNGSLVTVQQPDNRVVMAGLNLGDGSRVIFSDPDDHTTWPSNNFVDLSPGDGERIQALIGWRDFVFAFKQTKTFVFYGNTVDGNGDPIFNYRTIVGMGVAKSTADGLLQAPVVAAQEGVYFINEGNDQTTQIGITDGIGFNIISNSIGATLSRRASAYDYPHYATYSRFSEFTHIVKTQHFLYMPCTGQNGDIGFNTVLVYDIPHRDFFIHVYNPQGSATGGVAASAFSDTNWQLRGLDDVVWTGNGDVLITAPTQTSDNGTAIGSLYRFGYSDLGLPDNQKTIRETLLWGTGTVGAQLGSDLSALDTSVSVTLTATPTSAPVMGRRRVAKRGMNFSVALSATSGQWSVNRIIHNLKGPPRVAGKGSG